MTSRLILASTSPYRAKLLARLQLQFTQHAPDFTEALPGSMPVGQLVQHNSLGKARAVLQRFPDAHVIASDQLAVCGDRVLGKPGSMDVACQQLAELSGQRVSFLTGLALLSSDAERVATVPFEVCFRSLSASQIHSYVQAELPLDCAGSFKSEGLGIALFESMQGDDPTALIGLPLIRLCTWLQPLQRLHAVGH